MAREATETAECGQCSQSEPMRSSVQEPSRLTRRGKTEESCEAPPRDASSDTSEENHDNSRPPVNMPDCSGVGLSHAYLISVSSLNIGKYIEITIVPTIAPTPIIKIGSMIDVSEAMLASTSSS